MAESVLSLVLELKDTASGLLDDFGGKLTVLGAGAAALGVAGTVAMQAFDFAGQARDSVNDLQAALGVTEQDAQRLGDVATDVFANNWGDSLADTTEAVKLVAQQFSDLNNTDMSALSGKAFALRDNFGVDLADSISTAKQLTEQFGISTDQAMDFIASGFQRGLDKSGDFLDSINEYSVQFAQGGSDAGQFFSVLETGLQSGTLGTDKIADAFKESRIRITELSDDVLDAFTTIGDNGIGEKIQASMGGVGDLFIDTEEKARKAQEALASMGINTSIEKLMHPLVELDEKTGQITSRAQKFGEALSSEIFNGLDQGTLSVATAQNIALEGLKGMDNQVWQNTAGVQIFGTQWEDMGANALLAVDTTKTSLGDLEGATDSLNAKYDNFGSVFEGIKRQALVAIQPIGDAMLSLANEAMPLVTASFEAIKPAIDGVVALLTGDLGGASAALSAIFPPEIANGIISGITLVVDGIGGLIGMLQSGGAGVSGFGAAWAMVQPVIDAAVAAYSNVINAVLPQIQAFIAAHGTEIQAFFTTAFNTVVAIVQAALGLYAAIVPPALQAIAGFITAHGTEIQTILGGVWSVVEGIITGALAIIQGTVQTVLAVVNGDWAGAWAAIQATATTVGGALQTIITGALNIILGLFGTSVQGITTAWTNGLNQLKTIVQTALNDIPGTIRGMISTFSSAAQSIGSAISDGILAALRSGKDSIIRFIISVGQGALDAIKDFFNIHSPSQRMHDEVGLPIVQGIIGGMQAGAPLLIAAAQNMSQMAQNAINQAFANGTNLSPEWLAAFSNAGEQRTASLGAANRQFNTFFDHPVDTRMGDLANDQALRNLAAPDVSGTADAYNTISAAMANAKTEALAFQATYGGDSGQKFFDEQSKYLQQSAGIARQIGEQQMIIDAALEKRKQYREGSDKYKEQTAIIAAAEQRQQGYRDDQAHADALHEIPMENIETEAHAKRDATQETFDQQVAAANNAYAQEQARIEEVKQTLQEHIAAYAEGMRRTNLAEGANLYDAFADATAKMVALRKSTTPTREEAMRALGLADLEAPDLSKTSNADYQAAWARYQTMKADQDKAIAKYQQDAAQAGTDVAGQIAEARRAAEELAKVSPEAAAKQFDLDQKHIFDIADLKKQLAGAGNEADRAAIQSMIDDTERAYASRSELFDTTISDYTKDLRDLLNESQEAAADAFATMGDTTLTGVVDALQGVLDAGSSALLAAVGGVQTAVTKAFPINADSGFGATQPDKGPGRGEDAGALLSEYQQNAGRQINVGGITVTAGKGMDERQVADLVVEKIADRERELARAGDRNTRNTRNRI